MPPLLATMPSRRLIGLLAFAMGLAGFTWTPSVATAGCGGYVLVNGKLLHDTPRPTVALNEFGSLPLGVPCQGPHCTQDRESVPALPPAVIEIPRVEAIGLSTFLIFERSNPVHPLDTSVSRVPPVVLAGIFRPPR